ncbi:ribonuclease HII [Lactovum miscens]|uniref:Ribonuclease HII n=1 Tax=Lactovum miscens TaxID=190387 RepID=A0A841C8S6_9LACT|nr:ribonuclease HII [Lactovum miscens]MBB5888707.1 ribonuclease HII [Lactovum miscens]
MPQTIKEIKQQLTQISDLNDPKLIEFSLDLRIGVQNLILQKKKKLKATILESKRLEKMLIFEKELYSQGIKFIAGIDEVGRGPLAGPVVTAAVILPENCKIPGLNDSKQIPKSKHKKIYQEILNQALSVAIGSCSPEEIDEINIYQASRKAMAEAVLKLNPFPEYLLIDALRIDINLPQISIIKGDAKSMSIAAASIVAKVTRDQIMTQYDELYPGYDFAHNAGYGTVKHMEALKVLGVTPIHRKTFSPVTELLNKPIL